jgi:hypothetical protein
MRKLLISLAASLALLTAPLCGARGRVAESLLVARESSQAIQNARADAFHLTRLTDLAMVREFSAEGRLVPVPAATTYYYVDGVSADYRYLRPWSKLFLDRISRDYYERFGEPLRVTSMLRTVQLQRRLTYTNPNAADATGADRSTHLTGATLDISKKLMDYRGVLWMRSMLIHLREQGYLYAIEEFQEPCFHVMVFPTYRDYTGAPVGQPALRRAAVSRRSVRRVSAHRAYIRRRHRLHAAHRAVVARATTHPATPGQPAS